MLFGGRSFPRDPSPELTLPRLVLPGFVLPLLERGCVTGASGRNWVGYGADVALPADFSPQAQALLTDPQTSGGLLVSCAPSAVDQVMGVFARHGFADAAVVGAMQQRPADAALLAVH